MRTRLSIFCDKMIEAGWLAAVIIVPLFFNIYSQRVFEPDKLIPPALHRPGHERRLGHPRGRGLARQPGARRHRPGTGGFPSGSGVQRPPWCCPRCCWYWSISSARRPPVAPRVSFWGSYQRLQGTYTTLSYIVDLFPGAAGTAHQETAQPAHHGHGPGQLSHRHVWPDPALWPGSTALGGNVTTRVASNMGNAIFVAAYLIMVVPLTLSRLLRELEGGGGRLGYSGWRSGTGGLCPAGGRPAGGDALAVVRAGGPWLRWVALLIGIGLQVPIYLLSPAERRPRVLAISLPLTFAFLVGFSWILEIFFPAGQSPTFSGWACWPRSSLCWPCSPLPTICASRSPGCCCLAGYFVILIAQIVASFTRRAEARCWVSWLALFFYFALLGLVKRTGMASLADERSGCCGTCLPGDVQHRRISGHGDPARSALRGPSGQGPADRDGNRQGPCI